jgi:uncharacterized repeat protein (TIGR03803 family)
MNYTELLAFQGPPKSGAAPLAGVVMGAPGELFGTTAGGGHANCGTVYLLKPNGIAQFFSIPGGNFGSAPYCDLAVDLHAGILYGCCTQNGKFGLGVLFALTLPGGGLGGATYHVLVQFDGLTNGSWPSGAVLGPRGILYGVTNGAQATNMTLGTVFSFNPANGVFSNLHVFAGPDGAGPNADLIFDPAGNLFGTTNGGGANGVGTVFSISPSGNFTSLASFPGGPGGGSFPGGGVVVDPATGTLYGMTNSGGAAGVGAVYSLSPNGVLTTLHSFNGGGILTDGNSPVGGVVLDKLRGCLYATGQLGGGPTGNAAGTVIQVALVAPHHLTVLHTFLDPKDGAYPISLIGDALNPIRLYGTTNQGGSANLGVVFRMA